MHKSLKKTTPDGSEKNRINVYLKCFTFEIL